MARPENKGSGAKPELALASLSVHADDHISAHRAVAPAMHVSTTFRYSDNPDDLVPDENVDVRIRPSGVPSHRAWDPTQQAQTDKTSPPRRATRTCTPASHPPTSPASRPS